MAIDYSVFAIPKSRVKALDRDDDRKKLAVEDKKESAKARKRANGQCEVQTVLVGTAGRKAVALRCERTDRETHHLIGGIGRRNKGKSILADYKLRVCSECHAAITANILRPTTAEHDAMTVRYWRAK